MLRFLSALQLRAAFRSLASILCFALGALGCLTPVPGRTQEPQRAFRQRIRPEVANKTAALVGTLPDDQQLALSFVLPLRNQTDLTSLLGRLYDPSSPDYRHFLAVTDFTAQFGPTPDSFQAVVAFARANGLTVTDTPANRLVVPVTGSVRAINRALGISMRVYQHPSENRTFFSPDREPSLPAGLDVSHISGLNNYALPRPRVVRPQTAQGVPSDVTGSGPGGSYLGSDMRAAYYGGTTLTGLGQSVGLVEFSGYDIADVNSTFANAGQTYGVPVNNVLLDGATLTSSDPDAEGEVVLDIVQAIGMAPGLDQVRVYIGTGPDDPTVLNKMASENVAKILSCSWSWQPLDPDTDDVIFQEFAAQGQSFLAASGDNGAYDSAISPYFYPQEDAYLTAVGGTHLTTTGAAGGWTGETAWNSYGAGSGGGVSPDNIAIPSWQSGLANAANSGSTTLRNVPDVAMEGDFDNYTCAQGTCSGGWAGTSFAAPRWAGFLALVNQQAVEAGTAPQGGIGFINPAIYRLAQSADASADFHDVTSGNNQTYYQSVWFNAVSGYDLVTGWGSANGQSLIDALAGPQVPGFWLQASSPTVNIEQGKSGTTTLSVVDAGGFTGTVNLAISSALPAGVTASLGTNPTSGTSVLTLRAASTAAPSTTPFTITGTSGNVTVQTTVTVAVHAPTFLLSASPNPVSLDQGQTGTTTLTVTPQYGFTGAVNLAVSGLPSGVTAVLGTNPTSGTSTLTLTTAPTAVPGTYPLTITGTSGSLSVVLSLPLSVHGPSFELLSSNSVDIGQGAAATDSVYVDAEYGFFGSVHLAVTGLPAGVTAAFSPNPTTNTSLLTFNASAAAATGSSLVTITGTSGNLSATTTTMLRVHVPTFTLSSPNSFSVGQGSAATSNLYAVPQYGFSGNVTFSVAGLPAGVTALWSPNPTSGTATLTLSAAPSTAIGQYPLTITGTSGSQSATATATLGVYAPTFTLTSSGISLGQGTTSTSYVYVTPQYGFTGNVTLAASNLPAGVTVSFSPNSTTGQSNVSFTASSSTATGQYTVTLTGTSGTKSASTTLVLAIYQPIFTLPSLFPVFVGQGASASVYTYIIPQYGFTGNVTLAVSGLPAGVTATASPNPTNGSALLTFTASSSAAVGQYKATLTGTSGNQTVTAHFTVGVYVPTFTISTQTAISIGQGSSSTDYIYLQDQYGFAGNVHLAVTGLPNGVTASFSPNSTTNSSLLTLTASSAVAVGQYALTITGTSGNQTVSEPVSLSVSAPTFLVNTASPFYIGQGSSNSTYVSIEPQYGFSGAVTLALTGLPAGVTATFSPNSTTGYSNLTLNASSTAAIGQYPLTLTGTSGSLTVTTPLTLNVSAQSFNIYGGYGNVSLNQGGSVTASFYISGQYGFSSPVTMSASGLPSGVTATFSPNPATSNSTVTLAATGTASPGQATVTITGTSGAITASTTLPLTVNASNFSLVDAPGEISLPPGASGKSIVTVLPQNGFTGSVHLALSGLPAGVTGSFSADTTTDTDVLTLSTSSAASAGTTTATVTGTSGSLTVTTPLTIVVSAAVPTTATTLSVSSAGAPVTSVAAHSAVTLQASVAAGGTPVSAGQVLFCDTAAANCNSTNLIGTAQLTSNGTAGLSLVLGPGVHALKATFLGVSGQGASTSAGTALTVTAQQSTATTIAQSGSVGQYTLTATVTGAGAAAPTGQVAFLDTTNGKANLGTAKLTPSGATLSLSTGPISATNSVPAAAAVADLNGDGVLDLVLSRQDSDSVDILLGRGDGSFAASGTSLATGGQPATLLIADFNADGKPDIAVVSSYVGAISIFLGNGDGTFTPSPLSPQAGSLPQGMAVGDFNRDGKLDLVVVNEYSSSLTVLLGNGDGTFTPSPLSPQTGSYPSAVATADFNGDGIPDVAVTNANSNTVSILLGNGDGTFSAVESVAVSSGPRALVAGDFNDDGHADLAVVNGYGGTLTLLLGNGDATFTTSSLTTSVDSLLSLAVADLNNDGVQDLIVAGWNQTATLLGKGDGTFTTGPSAALSGSLPFVLVNDFDGDGIPDLLTTGGFTQSVNVYPGQLTQTAVATATGINPAGAGTHALEAAYAGDSAWNASTSSTAQLTGQILGPTVAVAPAAPSITTAQALAVTITVSAPGGNPSPTGTVLLSSGSFTATATLLNGTAVVTVPAKALSPGNATLTAAYTPDAASSSLYTTASGSATLTVTAAPTTPGPGTAAASITVTASPAVVTDMQSITATVAVTGNGAPTGTVVLSTGSYSEQQILAGGMATFSLPAGTLVSGVNTLSAVYSGDLTFAAATGTTTVTAAPLVLSASAPSPVAAGATSSSTLTLTAGSYAGTVNLSCALTSSPQAAQNVPTCAVSPSAVAIGSGKAVSATLSLHSTGASTALAVPPLWRAFGMGGPVLASFCLLFFPRRRRLSLPFLAACLLLGWSTALMGCGGGASSGGTKPIATTAATTSGQYTFTVTGADATNAKPVTSTTVVFTVQ